RRSDLHPIVRHLDPDPVRLAGGLAEDRAVLLQLGGDLDREAGALTLDRESEMRPLRRDDALRELLPGLDRLVVDRDDPVARAEPRALGREADADAADARLRGRHVDAD